MTNPDDLAYLFTVDKIVGSNDLVCKYIFKNDAIAEAVLYKYPSFKERTVICCSTQSGCPVGCSFCGTGKNFLRNLTTDEIIFQIEYLLNETKINPNEIDKLQIMFMSMGEPMLNLDNLLTSIEALFAKYPKAKYLVSSSAPEISLVQYQKIIDFSEQFSGVGLQFSVHESTDENRKKLIPTKTKKLDEISKIGKLFFEQTLRKPFINYCVHNGNSTTEDAERLCGLFDPSIFEVTLSVISSANETVKASIDRQLDLIAGFNSKLIKLGFSTRVFNPAGQDDIGGGCGQLWQTQKFFNALNEKKGGE
jgi:23S rRNA (adenine2503-C2)-methyltransferase